MLRSLGNYAVSSREVSGLPPMGAEQVASPGAHKDARR